MNPKRSMLPLVVLLTSAAVAGCAARGAAAGAARAELSPRGAAADVTMGLVRDPALAAALGEVDAGRIRATDSTLVAFGTRHTLSDTVSATRGIGAARRWLHATLAGYARDCGGCLRVEYDTATVPLERLPGRPAAHLVNVLAWLPGRDTARVVVIGGHYDSCICSLDRADAASDAPGANDDASGTAAVVELARVFSRRFPRGLHATVVFALYAGEEQGLLGSTHLARRLHAEGRTVVAGMTDDIVGNVLSGDSAGHDPVRADSTSVRIFAADPDNGPSRELGRYVWALARLYTPDFTVVPVWRLDRLGRGGDHIPFQRLGDPALRFSERVEDWRRQHRPADLFASVNPGYIARVARLNAAAVGALGLAPPPPDSVRAERATLERVRGGQGWTLRWQAVPGATGYEVLLRRTSAPTWERVLPAGPATSYDLAEQLDDLWAGVRSVGPDGQRSLVAGAP
ncbi:MAG TPA: M28 family metallopeptidase [Gemmatimonadales bacterium]|nr:M28 family metallopeptidase [Gemmatimonadales bacterium]